MDAYASQPHYWHHLQPIWTELDNPGTVYLPPTVSPHTTTHHTVAHHPPPGRTSILVAGASDLGRVGDRPVVFVEHGAGQTYLTPHPSYAGGPGRENVRLFLCPNQRVADANSVYPVPSEVVGSPRLEYLATIQGPGKVPAVAFHWNCDLLPETRSAFPTYRRILPELDGIGHAHPRLWGAAKPAFKHAGLRPVQWWHDVIAEGIGVLAADNTSVMWEAAALGIPVVVINLNTYRRHVQHGLRFWEYADVGPQVDHPSELADIAKSWRDWQGVYTSRRLEVAEALYGTLVGSAWRAADAIRSHGMT